MPQQLFKIRVMGSDVGNSCEGAEERWMGMQKKIKLAWIQGERKGRVRQDICRNRTKKEKRMLRWALVWPTMR